MIKVGYGALCLVADLGLYPVGTEAGKGEMLVPIILHSEQVLVYVPLWPDICFCCPQNTE